MLMISVAFKTDTVNQVVTKSLEDDTRMDYVDEFRMTNYEYEWGLRYLAGRK